MLLPPARAFLAQFGGLTITGPPPKARGTPGDLVAGALLAAGGRDPDWAHGYERRAGEPALTPAGQAAGGHLIACMGAGGAVHGGYDDVRRRLGSCGDDAIEGAVHRPRPRLVPAAAGALAGAWATTIGGRLRNGPGPRSRGRRDPG
jgi:hypothetical protein